MRLCHRYYIASRRDGPNRACDSLLCLSSALCRRYDELDSSRLTVFCIINCPSVSRCRFNRLLKLGRVREFMLKADFRSSNPETLRLVSLVITLLVVIHWNACIYIAISDHIGFGSDGWVYGTKATAEYFFLRTLNFLMHPLETYADVPCNSC